MSDIEIRRVGSRAQIVGKTDVGRNWIQDHVDCDGSPINIQAELIPDFVEDVKKARLTVDVVN